MLLSEQNENQTSDENTNDSQQLTNTWNSIELEFVEFWTEILKTSDATYDEEGDDIENQTIVSDCDDIEPVFDRFRALITEKKFKTGLSLLKKLREEFPDNEIITHRDDEEMNESDDNENTDEEMDSEDNPNNKSKNKRQVLYSNVTNAEKSILDLGSKAVERDIEKIATVLIRSSQQTEENIESQSRAPTTTIQVARLSIDRTDGSAESIVNDISRQQILVKYLSDCIKFTEQIQIAIPLVSDLLLSRNITDIQEAIEFFVSAYKFGVKDAIFGVRKLILLVWSQEKSIKDSAVSAYKRIYLDFESDARLSEMSEKHKAFSVVKSLSELVMGATLGELISIEQLLKELMDSNEIQQIHIQVLWERFSMKLTNTTSEESRVAIQLIGMLSTSNPELIRSKENLNAIITEGLGERGRKDSRLVSETCIALGKAYRLPKTDTCEQFYRLPKDHELFTHLRTILLNGLDNLSDNYYDMMSDNIIKVIFQLAEHPDSLSEQFIREMLLKLISLTQSEELTTDMQTVSLDNANKENCEQISNQDITEADR
ncbi:unnamed protein product, partial [Medioppia subpectinata]